MADLAGAAEMLSGIFGWFDKDGDGYLNLEEFNQLQVSTGSDAVRNYLSLADL